MKRRLTRTFRRIGFFVSLGFCCWGAMPGGVAQTPEPRPRVWCAVLECMEQGARALGRLANAELEKRLEVTAAATAPASTELTRPARRPLVAVCPLNNAAADPAVEPWRHAFAKILTGRLGAADGLGVISWGELKPALVDAGWSLMHDITPDLAERAGRELALTHVIWGGIREQDGEWSLALRLPAIGSSNAAPVILLKDRSLGELMARAPGVVIERLGAKLDPVWEAGWRRRSGPNCAWNAVAEVLHLERCGAPPARLQELLRQILSEEPGFVPARSELFGQLAQGGNVLEAEAHAEEILRQAPDWCMPHLMLAQVHLSRGNTPAAERHLHEALRLDPGCPESCQLLSFAFHGGDRWSELGGIFEVALLEKPGQVSILAFAAHGRLHSGDAEGAARLLAQIDQTRSETPLVQSILLEVAARTKNSAVFGQAIRSLRAVAGEEPLARVFLQSADSTFFIGNLDHYDPPLQRPQSYSPEELGHVLQRVAEEDQVTLVNPLENTPAITRLAASITAGFTNPAVRAFLIFDEVTRRGRGPGAGGIRTAAQALLDSEKPDTGLSCQEFAKLFVTLARAAGLESWLVHVDIDHFGKAASHDCAVLFLHDQAFLVDPTWGEFAIHHQQYRLLSDVQAIAHQAMQGTASEPDLPRRRAGLKLDPDDRWTRLQWVQALAQTGRGEQAEAEFTREAIQSYTQAASQGDAQAQYLLALLLYEGKRAPADPAAAFQWALIALANGHQEAIALVDEMRLFLEPGQIEEATRRAKDFRPAR